eukprot:1968094-Prorocentrum_lima.AAC.1
MQMDFPPAAHDVSASAAAANWRSATYLSDLVVQEDDEHWGQKNIVNSSLKQVILLRSLIPL